MGRRTIFSKAVSLWAVGLVAQGVAFGQTSSKVTHTFQNIRYIAPFGAGSQTVDAVLHFDEHQLILRSKTDGRDLRVMSFTSIKSADYSYGKNLPWKPGIGFALVFFLGSEKHWLTVQSDREVVVMQLDNRNFKVVLSALESRAGVKVQAVREETYSSQ